MEKCFERVGGSVARVDAYPVGGISVTIPNYVRILTAKSSSVKYSGLPIRIPFSSRTMKITDQNADGVNGFTHTIGLEWETSSDEYALSCVDALQNNAHDLLVTYFGGTKKVIRTDETSYKFTFREEDGALKCSMSLVNGQGLILLV